MTIQVDDVLGVELKSENRRGVWNNFQFCNKRISFEISIMQQYSDTTYPKRVGEGKFYFCLDNSTDTSAACSLLFLSVAHKNQGPIFSSFVEKERYSQ